MSEIEAKERYYWSKIRQALKSGDIRTAGHYITDADCHHAPGLVQVLENRASATFTAGCIALGDPAPLDKEQEHE